MSILVPMTSYAKKMYRWVDEQGNIRFSDQIPQNQIQHKREALNENARVVEVIEEAKTQEQIELEKRLKKLRWEQEKIITKQKSHDKVLLSTFRNINDMKMALKGKLSALNAQRKVAEGNRVRLQNQLAKQQKQAANIERNGRQVSKSLINEIASTKEQIDYSDIEILRHTEKKLLVKRNFEKDIERFIFLTQTKDSTKLSSQTAETKAANELGLYICKAAPECENAWNSARKFVAKHSTTKIDIDSDKLIMRAAPMGDDDLSLSVSRLNLDQGRQQLFLDIRCRKSTVGIELCASDQVKSIRRSFNRFIASDLSTQ